MMKVGGGGLWGEAAIPVILHYLQPWVNRTAPIQSEWSFSKMCSFSSNYPLSEWAGHQFYTFVVLSKATWIESEQFVMIQTRNC